MSIFIWEERDRDASMDRKEGHDMSDRQKGSVQEHATAETNHAWIPDVSLMTAFKWETRVIYSHRI